MAQTVRVLYSIRSDVLGRFNNMFKGRQRSRAIGQLMERAIAEREAEVVSAARQIETDPDFADVRAISDEVDASPPKPPPSTCREPNARRHPFDRFARPRSEGAEIEKRRPRV